MKILYVAGLSPNDSSLYRQWAIERAGHTVIPINIFEYESPRPLVRKIVHRLNAGPGVRGLNAEILRRAVAEQVDIVWGDKVLWMLPATLKTLRSLGVTTVDYTIDNPFGPRKDPGWGLFVKAIPFYDLHVVQRDKNIADYRSQGARDVLKIQTAYEPTIHFPPPPGWSDRDRDREVSFIGTPYDDRAATLLKLSELGEFHVAVSGNRRSWVRALGDEAFAKLYREGELYQQQYREAIWRSRINLSFLTHSNEDEFVHKSFEIAACGGFLLAERSDGHLDRFKEDVEAVFFSTLEECAEKIRKYLPDEAARTKIAEAGRLRAARDGYHNDRQVQLILERAAGIHVATMEARHRSSSLPRT